VQAPTVCLAFLFVVGLAAAKEKPTVLNPPPLAVSGTAAVYIGESVEIPLQVRGRVVDPLQFLIRKAPANGVLSELQRTGEKEAKVTYTPAENASPGGDAFTFAAQSADSPVSAPATVVIRINHRPAHLSYEKELDFGTVYLGQSVEKQLEISNSGGLPTAFQMEIKPPWRLESDPLVKVPARTVVVLSLIFAPQEERDFVAKVPLGKDPSGWVLLRGSARLPLLWKKEGIVISPGNRKNEDAVAMEFTNVMPVAGTLKIEWPNFLIGPASTEIGPNQSITINATLKAPENLMYEGLIPLRFGDFADALPVRVYPTPARWVVEPGRRIVLGRDRDHPSRMTIRNEGGSEGTVRIKASDGIEVTPEPSRVEIAAGEKREFEVRIAKEHPDLSQGKLVVECSGVAAFDVEVVTDAPTKPSAARAVGRYLNLTPLPVQPAGDTPGASSKLAALKVGDVQSEVHEIRIPWTVPSGDGNRSFLIEKRKIGLGKDGEVVAEWVPWMGARVQVEGRLATATLSNLPSDSGWTVRVTGLDAQGRPVSRSDEFRVITQKIEPLRVPGWFWLILLALLAGTTLRIARNRRRALLAREDEKLARLEAE
jgi:hypothetical protein